MHSFGEDTTHKVDVTQEEMEFLIQHRLRMDESTGSTPRRRKYDYPQTWGRTRPSQDLLKEFREIGRVDSFTTEEHTLREPSELDEDAAQPSSPSERYDARDTQERVFLSDGIALAVLFIFFMYLLCYRSFKKRKHGL